MRWRRSPPHIPPLELCACRSARAGFKIKVHPSSIKDVLGTWRALGKMSLRPQGQWQIMVRPLQYRLDSWPGLRSIFLKFNSQRRGKCRLHAHGRHKGHRTTPSYGGQVSRLGQDARCPRTLNPGKPGHCLLLDKPLFCRNTDVREFVNMRRFLSEDGVRVLK